MEEVRTLQDLVHLSLNKQLLFLMSRDLVSLQALYHHKEVFGNLNIPILNSQLFPSPHQQVALVHQDYCQNTEVFSWMM